MSEEKTELLHALKIAFCYMPKAIEVNKYDHGDKVDEILSDIAAVREALEIHGIDPEEVQDEIRPGSAPNSCY
jgi:hypothetical protein